MTQIWNVADGLEDVIQILECAERPARRESNFDAPQTLRNYLERRMNMLRDNERLGVAVLQNVGSFRRREMPIDGGVNQAEALRGPAHGEIIQTICHHNRDMIALRNAIGAEVPRELSRPQV